MNIEIDVDWKPTLEWLDQIKKGMGDARPLWIAMIPRIKEFVNYEFAGGNPNKWRTLTPKYKKWKIKNGFPGVIGTMTGKMMMAAGDDARIETNPKFLRWGLDQSKTKTKTGKSYSTYFSFGTKKMPARPIYKTTILRINNLLQQDINSMEGGSRMAFTFRWIEKAVDPSRVQRKARK